VKPGPIDMRFPILVGIPIAVAVVSALLASGGAQRPTGVRRTSDGKPDLSGVWQSGGVSLYGDQGRAGAPTAPSGTPPPRREPLSYQPWAAERQKQLTAVDDPTAHCLLPGVPRITSMPMPFEIVQTPKKVVILYESFHAFRIVPIDDRLTHPDDVTPTWMGDSVARWDGDTLVVDVTGFNDRTWLGGVGTIHTEALHVVERFTLTPDHTIAYSAIVEDPKALTKPWTTGVTLREPKDARVEEYECIENNQDPAHMVPKK
jgi:hypothetical protein